MAKNKGRLTVGFVMPVLENAGGSIYFRSLSQNLRSVEPKIISFRDYLGWGVFPKTPHFDKKLLDSVDVIHSSIGYGFLRTFHKPSVVTIHHSVFDNEYLRHASLVQKIFYTLFLRRYFVRDLKAADQVIAVSNYSMNSVKKSFKEFSNLPIKVIHNGIDTDKFHPIKVVKEGGRVRLLFVGNLIHRKGVDLLPRIMDKLGDSYVLYYTSGLRDSGYLKHKNARPLGKISDEDLIKEYNKCDIFLFPTRLEGFGYAVAEAMACQKPVVTTNCSSLPELVGDGKNGFLCKMDDVADFARKIEILGKDRVLREKMGREGRKIVLRKFSLKKMVSEHEKIYSALEDTFFK